MATITPPAPSPASKRRWVASAVKKKPLAMVSSDASHEIFVAAAPAGGAIIAITDYLGLQPWTAFAAHGAAKAAQIHLVKELARAWTTDGVRVCGVAPGPVDLADDEHRAATLRAAAKVAAERLVAPADVGAAVRFCLETDAVTGVNVVVDNGSLVMS